MELWHFFSNIYTDLFIVSIPLVMYLSRVLINPAKAEAEMLIKVSLPIVAFLLRKLSEWTKHHPSMHNEIKEIHSDVYNLRRFIKKPKG